MERGHELESLMATGELTGAAELFDQLRIEVEPVLLLLRRFVDTGEM